MSTRTFLWVTALALCFESSVLADPPDVCGLITAAEVGRAVGVTVGPSTHHEDKVPLGPLKDQPRLGCSWNIGAGEKDRARRGIVLLNHVPVAAAGRPVSAAEFRRALLMPQPDWTVEEVAVGDAFCVVTTTGLESAGTWTGCSVAARGYMISIEARGRPVETTPKKLKRLLDLAARRLPER